MDAGGRGSERRRPNVVGSSPVDQQAAVAERWVGVGWRWGADHYDQESRLREHVQQKASSIQDYGTHP